MLKNYCQLR
jgi:hypothetical protein